MAADTRVMGVMAIGAHVVVVQLVAVVMGSCSSGRRRCSVPISFFAFWRCRRLSSSSSAAADSLIAQLQLQQQPQCCLAEQFNWQCQSLWNS